MSSNPLMMDYGRGDLLLAGPPPVAGSLRRPVCAGFGGDLNTAWRLSFSDKKCARGVYTQDALYESTSYLTGTNFALFSVQMLHFQS